MSNAFLPLRSIAGFALAASLLVVSAPAATEVTVTASNTFQDVAFGDFNRDGLLDLVATSRDNRGVRLFLVDASRNWTEDSDNLPNTGHFNGVSAFDADRDGWLDIAVGSAGSDNVVVFLRRGANTWTAASTDAETPANVVNELCPVDINRDGFTDLLATYSGWGVRVIQSQNGVFWTDKVTHPTDTGSYWGVAAWNWTNNDWLDVVAADTAGNGLTYWSQSSSYNWITGDDDLPDVGNYHQIAIGDCDHDGLWDIFATWTKGAAAFSGDEPGFDPIATGLPSGDTLSMSGIAAGNTPPDQYVDFFAAHSSSGGITANKGLVGSRWLQSDPLTDKSGLWGLAIGDSDLDGAEDIAGAPNLGGIKVWYNAPTALAADWAETSSPSKLSVKGRCVDYADTNRDGRVDLLIGSEGDGLQLWRGDGGNSWIDVSGATLPTAGSVPAARFGDFNYDGDPDFAYVTSSGDGVGAFRNDNTGSFLDESTGLPSTGIYWDMDWGDLRQNGLDELVLASKSNGVQVFRYRPATTDWVAVTSPFAAGEITCLRLADFDRDGLLDVVFGLPANGLRAYRQTAVDTWADMSGNLPVSGDYSRLEVADFDNDGDTDVVAIKIVDNIIKPFANTYGGAKNWNAGPSIALTGKPYCLDLADHNIDGAVDILCGGVGFGLSVYEATTPGAWTLATTGSLPTTTTVNGCRFAPIDLDKSPDVVGVSDDPYCEVHLFGDGTPPGNWRNFSPAGWVHTVTATTCAIDVSETLSGLDPSTAQYEFSRNGGSDWFGPYPATCDATTGGAHGTITAAAVPFNQESWGQNKIRFSIADIGGNIGHSPSYYVKIDATAPPTPTGLDSFYHDERVWADSSIMRVSWNEMIDNASGTSGYSYVFDRLPTTTPDDAIETIWTYRTAYSDPLVDANNWYFHIRSVDRAGNASGAAHIGPFWIDTTPPTPPELEAPFHTTGLYTNDNNITIDVTHGVDALSGIVGTRTMFSQFDATRPRMGDLSMDTTIESGLLAAHHNWHCHAETIDEAGNISDPVHLGPFRFDMTPPICRLYVESLSTTTAIDLRWSGSDWPTAVEDYDVQYRRLGAPWWDEVLTATTDLETIVHGDIGSDYEFRARCRDSVGNYSPFTEPMGVRVGKDIIVLVNQHETGREVSGAEVWHNGHYVGRTNAMGALTLTAVMPFDRICTRKLVATFDTDRPGHGRHYTRPWMSKVYQTNLYPAYRGGHTFLIMDQDPPPDIYVMELKKNHPSIGFNIIVSIEWDASDEYIDIVREGMRKASDYLYDATDSEFYFANVEINDAKSRWSKADIIIKNETLRANAWVGYIHRGNTSKRITMPRHRGNYYDGSYDKIAGYSTFIHEFGHYGFNLKDEYFVYHGASKDDSYCTAKRFDEDDEDYGPSMPRSACVMDNQTRTRGFCAGSFVNPHNEDTNQDERRGGPCREEINDWYEGDDWNIVNGDSRMSPTSGPMNLAVRDWCHVEVANNADTDAFDILVTVTDDETGTAVVGASCTHITRDFKSIGVDNTHGHGQTMVYGVHDGERLVVSYEFLDETRAKTIYMYDPSPALEKGEKRRRFDAVSFDEALDEAPRINAVITPYPYSVYIDAKPGPTSRTMELAVWGGHPLLDAPEVMIWQGDHDTEMPIMPVLEYTTATYRYEGIVELDADLPANGWIWVNALDDHGLASEGTTEFCFLDREEGADLEHETYEGDLFLYAPAASLVSGSTLYYEKVDIPSTAPLPVGLVGVVGPWRLAGHPIPGIVGPANLGLSYTPEDEPEAAMFSELSIYRLDEISGVWILRPSTRFEAQGEIAAEIFSDGVFMVAGPRNTTGDTEKPAVTIDTPTAASEYLIDASMLPLLAGAVSDPGGSGVASMTWDNGHGSSGAFNFQDRWSVPNIPLQPGHNHITVTAIDAGGNIGRDQLLVLNGTQPIAPDLPDDTGPTTTTLTWTWRDNSNDENFFVVNSGPGVTPPVYESHVVTSGATQVTHEFLAPNRQYSFHVRAINDITFSDPSADYTAWTLAATPLPPDITDPTRVSLNVSIYDADTNPSTTEYAIYCPTSGQWLQADGSFGASEVWRTPASWQPVVCSGLNPETAYTFQAKARNGVGVETSLGSVSVGSTTKRLPKDWRTY